VDALDERKLSLVHLYIVSRDSNPTPRPRHPISFIQLNWFLLPLLGGSLPSFLPDGPATLSASLPSGLASALVTGAIVEFVFNLDPIGLDEPSYAPVADGKGGKRKGVVVAGKRSVLANERLGTQSLLATWAAAGVVMAVVIEAGISSCR
jgi:hypothetical protein